jgi:hypothetical protein
MVFENKKMDRKKIKIGIITLHRAENYGSVLQAFALQKVLEHLNFDVEILDYHPERYTNKGKLRRLKNQSARFSNPILLFVAKMLILPSYWRKNRVFERFISQHIRLSKNKFATNEEAKRMVWNADYYCVGSDQVWNSFYNETVEPVLYLDFLPNEKRRFSYASSIGLSEIPANEKLQMQQFLSSFVSLSLREKTGVNLVKELGFSNVEQVLDPTLLLDKDQWRLYLSEKSSKKKKYILTYNLHHDKRIDDYAKRFGKKHHLPVYNISYNWHDVVRPGNLLWCPEVSEFLGWIANAEYVIADSFHSTVFSVIFHKKFVTITPEVASSRVVDFLNMLNLEERNISSVETIDVIEQSIDYEKVEKLLIGYRQKSMEYLQRSIELCQR